MQILYAWPPLYYNPSSALLGTKSPLHCTPGRGWPTMHFGGGCVEHSPCRNCCCCGPNIRTDEQQQSLLRNIHWFMFGLNRKCDRNFICRNYLESKTLKVCIQSCVYSLFFVGMVIILHQLQRRKRWIYDFWRFTDSQRWETFLLLMRLKDNGDECKVWLMDW